MISTTAIAALIAGGAYAAEDLQNSQTQDRQNPQAVTDTPDETEQVTMEGAEDLQNSETADRQNPQAVDPEFEAAIAGMDAVSQDKLRRLNAQNGSPVVLNDGTQIGYIRDTELDNTGKAEMHITAAADGEVDAGSGTLDLLADAGKIDVRENVVHVDITEDELSVLGFDGFKTGTSRNARVVIE
jgi:hypothetical protein